MSAIDTVITNATVNAGDDPHLAKLAQDAQMEYSVYWANAQESANRIAALRAELAAAQERVKTLELSVLWALGYTNFKVRGEGDPPYWWRRELRERAGWHGDEANKAAERLLQEPPPPSPHTGETGEQG